MDRFRLGLLVALQLALGAGLAGLAHPAASQPPGGPAPAVTQQTYLPLIAYRAWYGLQPGSPVYLSNFINNAGCAYHGVAGRVFGADDRPVLGLVAHLTGGGLDVTSVTGSQPAIGPGGYEIVLGSAPIDSDGVYHLSLLSGTGEPLSAVYALRTYADCSKNLIAVNFTALERAFAVRHPAARTNRT